MREALAMLRDRREQAWPLRAGDRRRSKGKTGYKPQSRARPQQRTIVARRTEEIRPGRGR